MAGCLWDVPDELLTGPHTGPPICWDDVIDLHLALEALDAGASDQRPRPVAAPVTTSPRSAIHRLTAALRHKP